MMEIKKLNRNQGKRISAVAINNVLQFIMFIKNQYNCIDLRRRNSLSVRLRDRDAGWKDGCLNQLEIAHMRI